MSPTTLYLEDFAPGQAFHAGPTTVTVADAIAFAQAFDPQPFHLDAQAAKDSIFGGLALSGWHTAAISMRMLTESPLAAIANGLVGVEIRHMKWPRPARPGDTFDLTIEVLELRPSRTQPAFGTLGLRWTTRNQDGEVVLQLENVAWVARRPSLTDT